MIDYLPPSASGTVNREAFLIYPLEYDSQNFLIDDGSLTGIPDWDNVHTLLRYLGYASYPELLSA